PTLMAGSFTFILLSCIFRKDLIKPIKTTDDEVDIVGNKFLVGSSLRHLILCTIFLTISSYIEIEMYLISLGLLLSSSIVMVLYQTIKLQEYPAYFINTVKRMPWNLMPFVISMFIMAISLNKYGVTQNLNAWLSHIDPLYGYGF